MLLIINKKEQFKNEAHILSLMDYLGKNDAVAHPENYVREKRWFKPFLKYI